MSKLVCVDNSNRFYLPVDSIVSAEFVASEEDKDSGHAVIKYVVPCTEELQTYKVELRSYAADIYFKSLQQHMNALM